MRLKIKILTSICLYAWFTVFSATLCFASFYKSLESGYSKPLVLLVGIILSSMIVYIWVGYSLKMKKVFKYFFKFI